VCVVLSICSGGSLHSTEEIETACFCLDWGWKAVCAWEVTNLLTQPGEQGGRGWQEGVTSVCVEGGGHS
jgi:hypothetical protein